MRRSEALLGGLSELLTMTQFDSQPPDKNTGRGQLHNAVQAERGDGQAARRDT